MTDHTKFTHARKRMGWVVDVQRDFMEPDGRLYVHDLLAAGDPGATVARPTIVAAVQWMRAHCDVVVFTGDWHAIGDREIDAVHPDATRGTYPPHCMGCSGDPEERAGAALLPEIDPGDEAMILSRDASAETARAVAVHAVEQGRPVFIQKREFSVFEGNAATDAFLDALVGSLGERPDVILCGVATDVCVRHAVEGFLDRAFRVTVIADATHGLGLLPSARTWDAWTARGARVHSLARLMAHDQQD